MSTPNAAAAKRPFWQHPWWRHLRVHFNLLLTPIWLFGLVMGAQESGVTNPLLHPNTWLAWASLHLFLYGGTTAFNSYYDRDEGPVGGMLTPPPVDAGLLPFSLIVQAIGLALAVPVGASFTVAWLALFAVFTAYSHPSVRLKARPSTQLLAIGLGQGALGWALGWLVFAPVVGLLSPEALLRMGVTALIVLGLYIVTQSYQVVEDGARGDRTLPVLLGPSRALLLAAVMLAPGGLILVVDIARLADFRMAAFSLVVFSVLAVWMLRFAAGFDPQATARNYRVAMQIATTSAILLGGMLVWLLLVV